MIYNLELEKQLLAALIKEPDLFCEIANFIEHDDFYSEESNLHKTIFTIVKQAIESSEDIDEVIIAQRIASIGLSFEDKLNPSDYIKSLALRKVPKGNLIKTAKELKKVSVRRGIYKAAQDMAKQMKNISPDTSYHEIIEKADNVYNSRINLYEIGEDEPVNIYDEMEYMIEDRGNNPIEEFGMMGPHKKVNDMYGSILRPGNITVVVARSGVGKTQFCMHYATQVASVYDVPVLHFDNGEMSKEELIMRQCASMSGISSHLLESGKWRQAGDDVVAKVRETWDKVKNLKFYYYNVGGMDVDSMVNTLKRFYYSKVGRGNPMIFSFDYIKTTSEASDNKNEWQIVGEMVDKFKKCVQKEILHDGEPVIPMITSVQSNRYGITNNRTASNIVDDESIVSLSDRIIQFCSHMFILRNKTADEIEIEGGRFGTHKLINIKSRHLGKDVAGALEPVQVGDSLRKNSVNLEFKNFKITERGDLRDVARSMDGDAEIDASDVGSLPDFQNV
jgi:replicative DNA helicase